MPTPITRGTPYYSTFTSASPIIPIENGTITLTIGPKFSYVPGSSVIVSRYFNRATSFEAIVESYDPTASDIVLSEITNIRGDWTNISGQFYISLTGQRGSKILSGSSNPSSAVGRPGDMYIKSTNGQVYIKS